MTKYRRGVLDDAALSCCEKAMRKVCGDFGADLREFNGEADHVHLLIGYPLKVCVPAPVNPLNGAPARRPRAEFTSQVNQASTHGHLWSPSYLASSCGAPLSITRQHTEQQQRPA